MRACEVPRADGRHPVGRCVEGARGQGARRGGVRDRGSGTVLVLALVAVVLTLTGVLGLLVGAQAARGRAQVAADLAALAAAEKVAVPAGLGVSAAAVAAVDPCGTARLVATRNGAEVTTCGVLPCGVVPCGVVQVTTAVRAGVGVATAVARAGPAGARAR